MDVDKNDEGVKHWLQKIQNGETPENIWKYFKEVAAKENSEINKTDFADLLSKDDEGKRILYVMPKSIGDVYISTALFKDIKNNYPEYNLYVATEQEFFEILDGNPYVHKVLPYLPQMDNLPWLEGTSKHKGFFEVAFLPFIGTQRIFDYQHNGKDKISLELCTF
jgi:hypothetical protein